MARRGENILRTCGEGCEVEESRVCVLPACILVVSDGFGRETRTSGLEAWITRRINMPIWVEKLGFEVDRMTPPEHHCRGWRTRKAPNKSFGR